jgi:undecaprenyl-diphosphatase
MSYPEALMLALLQAVTEFLPVSSSGHLVLAQHWMGQTGDVDILYDVMLHLATTAAIVVYFRRDIADLLSGLVGAGSGDGVFRGAERSAAWHIALANVPTALVGLVIQRYLVPIVTRVDVVGLMLMITGTVLWLGRGRAPHRTARDMNGRDALQIGLVQGLAVVPGISRAGTTITGAIVLGLERELAAHFSLLIAVPAVLGAVVLELTHVRGVPAAVLGPYLAGMLVAGFAGYAAIDVILRLVRRRSFYLFAYYLWPLGALAILWQYLS